MKYIEIQKKNDAELVKMLDEKRKFVVDFRFEMAGARSRNPHELKDFTKDIARILTELQTRKNKE